MEPSQQATNRFQALNYLAWLLLGAGCLFLLFSLFVYGLGEPFARLGFSHPMRMSPPFADLRYLIANSECGVNLEDYYKGLVVGCDPAGRTYRFDYPPMSIWIGRFLHVRGVHTPLIAISTALAFIASLLGFLRLQLASSWRWCLLGAGLLMSFPLQQALERGNLDVIFFLATLLLCFLLSRPLRAMPAAFPVNLLSASLCFFLVSLKIYPLFGVIGLVARQQPRQKSSQRIQWQSPATKMLVLAASAAGILPLISYLKTVGNLIKEGGLGSHGLMAFGYMNQILIDWIGLEPARFAIRLLFVVKFVAIAVGFYLAFRSRLFDAPRTVAGPHGQAGGEFVALTMDVMGATWLGCYISTINYDYRFVFIIPFLGYLAGLVADPARAGLQRHWPACLVIMMMFVLLFPWLRLGYTGIGVLLVRILEPATEFLLIPMFAGSLLCCLLATTSIPVRLKGAALTA